MTNLLLPFYLNRNVTRIIQEYCLPDVDLLKERFKTRLQGELFVDEVRKEIGEPYIITPHMAIFDQAICRIGGGVSKSKITQLIGAENLRGYYHLMDFDQAFYNQTRGALGQHVITFEKNPDPEMLTEGLNPESPEYISLQEGGLVLETRYFWT